MQSLTDQVYAYEFWKPVGISMKINFHVFQASSHISIFFFFNKSKLWYTWITDAMQVASWLMFFNLLSAYL